MKRFVMFCLLAALLMSCDESETDQETVTIEEFPKMRWSHVPDRQEWNLAAIQALETHGKPLVEMVPGDIRTWCPAYPDAGADQRTAFWVGLLSAMAKHESTYKPTAVSPNGKWFGLMQISPATAQGYNCRAGTGTALKDGGDNLSCAIRIMAVTVPRDGVISGKDIRWLGVAADWGPMRVTSKRRDMSQWLNAQSFCRI